MDITRGEGGLEVMRVATARISLLYRFDYFVTFNSPLLLMKSEVLIRLDRADSISGVILSAAISPCTGIDYQDFTSGHFIEPRASFSVTF